MKYRTKEAGISILALCISLAIMLMVAITSISMVIDEDGILNSSELSKVENLKKTAREQVSLGCSTIKLVIEEASAKDNSYSAKANASLIQKNLLIVLNEDITFLTGKFSNDGTEAIDNQDSFIIVYQGDDYPGYKIVYTIGVTQKTVGIVDEAVVDLHQETEDETNSINDEIMNKYKDLNKKIALFVLMISLIVLITIIGIIMFVLKQKESHNEKISDANAIKHIARDIVTKACETVKISKITNGDISDIETLIIIQNNLLEKLNAQSKLDGIFTIDNDLEAPDKDTMNIIYEGDDYKSASGDENAKITYTVGVESNGFHLLKENSTVLGIDLTD